MLRRIASAFVVRPAPLVREALLSAAAAASLAAVVLWFGPPGTDFAAHVYQRAVFLEHGFVLWNNFWYAGRYSFVTYSLLYYPLAALIGIKVLAVASIAAAALAFAMVLGREWGPAARLSTRSFAVVWAGIVLSAAFPFALGAALALLALWALQAGHRLRFAALAVLALAASPLAFFLLVVLLLGIGIERRSSARIAVPILVVALAGLAELMLRRLFPGAGRYPFHLIDLGAIGLFCGYGVVLTRGVERARSIRWILVVYFFACVIAFAVPSELGANVERFRYAAPPVALLLASLRGWRPIWLVLPALALTISWNVTPLAKSLAGGERDVAAAPAYWSPVISFLHRHLPANYRVEAVDTIGHWPAAYLPEAGIPLVRGWYRQADFPGNAILYGRFGTRAYVSWLRALGVRYIVRTDSPPDYSAQAEAQLLGSGRSRLTVVFRSAHETVYRVPHAEPLVTGPAPARVTSLGESDIRLFVSAPGRYRVAVRYSPYWAAEQACVDGGEDGMIRLAAKRRGPIDLRFKLGTAKMLETLVGEGGRRCS